MDMEEEKQQQSQVLKALKALKRASKEVETNPIDEDGTNSPSMKALLQLEIGSEDLFGADPHLSTLSSLLSNLKSLAGSIGAHHKSFFLRRKSRSGTNEISRLASSIGSELQSWIDRETTHRLVYSLQHNNTDTTQERYQLLECLEARLSAGFDTEFQNVLLRSGAYDAVESALADSTTSKQDRERYAASILAMVRFNKNVFVGQVLMGPTVKTLVEMASVRSLRVLNGLISSIRSPLVDELHSDGDIKKIIGLLCSDVADGEVRELAFDCVLEIGYYGRKEAIDAMMEGGLIKCLVELQQQGYAQLEMQHFESAVVRFAVQLEVGEGLRQREKRAFKGEILKRVRDAVSSEAEAATILAEVLWGSTQW